MILSCILLTLSVLVLASCGGPLATVGPMEPEPEMEQAPQHLGTPASSKAEAPAWWLLWYRKEQLPEYAPQPVSSGALYKAAESVAREVEEIRDPLLGIGDTLEAAYMVPTNGPFLLQGSYQKRRLRLTRQAWTTLDRGQIQLKLSRLICGDDLEREKKNYLYPMRRTKTVKDVGCAVQVEVRNTSAQALVVTDHPAMGAAERLYLVSGGPVNIPLRPYASVSAGKSEKFPQGKAFKRSLSIAPGGTATLLLAPNVDVRNRGLRGDSPSLLIQANFLKRRVDHLRLEPTP